MPALDRILAAAAEDRAQHYQAPADRPSQRRAEDDAPRTRGWSAPTRVEHLELRDAAAGDGLLTFEGFASVYNRGYEMWDMFGPYTEQVSSGAGARSLATPELDVPLVLFHDRGRTIARTTNGSLEVTERTIGETEGLHVLAPALDPTDHDVAYIAPKLRAGLIDEMSFRFRITQGSWSPDWSEFHIEEYDIQRGDVAIVGYGANPHTVGAGLRAAGELPDLRELSEAQLRQLENQLHQIRRQRDPAEPAGMSLARLAQIDLATAVPPVVL